MKQTEEVAVNIPNRRNSITILIKKKGSSGKCIGDIHNRRS